MRFEMHTIQADKHQHKKRLAPQGMIVKTKNTINTKAPAGRKTKKKQQKYIFGHVTKTKPQKFSVSFASSNNMVEFLKCFVSRNRKNDNLAKHHFPSATAVCV